MSELRIDRLFPDPAKNLPVDEAFADLDLPSSAGRPYVAINMVTSVDGRAQVAGTAEGLGSRVDRRVMRLLRAGFEAGGRGPGARRATGFWPEIPDELAVRRGAAGRGWQPVSVVIAGSTPVDVARWHAGARRLL